MAPYNLELTIRFSDFRTDTVKGLRVLKRPQHLPATNVWKPYTVASLRLSLCLLPGGHPLLTARTTCRLVHACEHRGLVERDLPESHHPQRSMEGCQSRGRQEVRKRPRKQEPQAEVSQAPQKPCRGISMNNNNNTSSVHKQRNHFVVSFVMSVRSVDCYSNLFSRAFQ